MAINPIDLQAAISLVCPVISVTIGDSSNRATWIATFDPSATAQQQAAAANVIATFVYKNTIAASDLITRFMDAEYALLMQKRAQAIGAGNVSLVKQWDIAMTMIGGINLNTPAAQNFKSALVSAAVLTQARADIIFA